MTRPSDYIYIAATVLLTVCGQLLMKWRMTTLGVELKGDGFHKAKTLFVLLLDPFIMMSFFFALLAALSWMGALTKFELNFAYPFITLSFVCVVLASAWLFNETLTPSKILGVIIVMLGLIVLSRA